MKTRLLVLLVMFCSNTALADFSNAEFLLHPLLPWNDPFIIEMTGEWQTDCHPGEQKPVVSAYTGDTVLIEFETIVEHVTCNDVVTPYRVLVDMSDVVGDVEGNFEEIEITVRFGETEVTHTAILFCICSPQPYGPFIKPEEGLYYSSGLEKQGLLLARQNQRMGAYPLVYDESGSSEWLFGGGGIVEDVFFINLNELTGGQCLGCLPPDDPPQLDVVGKLTMLMDSEGIVQVKVNDGLFTPYEQLDFGYGSVDVGGSPPKVIPDLRGRWAFVDVDFDTPVPPDSGTSMLPLVFDIVRLRVGPAPPSPTYVTFELRDINKVPFAEMRCDYFNEDDEVVDYLVCDLYGPNLEDATSVFSVNFLSIERILITLTDYTGPVIGGGYQFSGTAVRID